ncbi:MAG: flagellar biosynthetic protein FliO [Lachnospiraceae bacterium]|nr:flagellar biosynthetic protein FliO [Lachnospiraceae bacterium]
MGYSDLCMLLTKLKESSPGPSGNAVNNIARFITLLLVFIFVLALTYWTTRFVAKTQKGRVKGVNLELIETLPLANGKFLQLVRTGGKYVVLACGKDEVNLITELESSEVEPAGEADRSFSAVLRSLRERAAGDGEKKEE